MSIQTKTSEQTIEAVGPITESKRPEWLGGAILTAVIVVPSLAMVILFNDDIEAFGLSLMQRYGQNWLDLILLVISAISCSPLVLPVWGYVIAGVSMGYNVFHLALVMAIGSAFGSLVTYLVGRYFAERQWVKNKFPNLLDNKWTIGRSRLYVALAIFLGTSSPIPCDILYAAAGAKQFPAGLFYLTTFAGRLVRYIYMGLGTSYAIGLF
ncbi:MAG TPA: VTT domain-containing protein [candidate division Zixibacteria bacterium]|nr:VTT domain-containing protein [candidate division Zixibacteria bacterium]